MFSSAKPPKHSQNTPTMKHLERNLMLSGVSRWEAHAVDRPLLNYVSDQSNYADVLDLTPRRKLSRSTLTASTRTPNKNDMNLGMSPLRTPGRRATRGV